MKNSKLETCIMKVPQPMKDTLKQFSTVSGLSQSEILRRSLTYYFHGHNFDAVPKVASNCNSVTG